MSENVSPMHCVTHSLITIVCCTGVFSWGGSVVFYYDLF